MLRSLAPFVLLSSLAVACGPDSQGDSQRGGTSESAAAGWRAASLALQDAAADLDVESEQSPEKFEAACPDGGTVSIDGEGGSQTFDLSVRFEACGSAGIRIDGELSYVGRISASTMEFDYVGELRFSGAVELSCVVDMSGRASAGIEGMQGVAEAEVHGSVCDFEASAVVGAGA